MPLDIRVVELLASRFCHDLVSPVGAIRNGLELIEEMNEDEEPNPAFMGEAIKLIDHSSGQADRRLRLFRLAYGLAGREMRGFIDARAALQGWLEGGKTTIDWPQGVPHDMAGGKAGLGKTLMNVAILAEEALTHGGAIALAGQGDEFSGRVTVTARGRPGALNPEADAALKGTTPVEDLTARTVHAYVTGRFAEYYGLRLSAAPAGTETLVFTLEW